MGPRVVRVDDDSVIRGVMGGQGAGWFGAGSHE